MAAWYGISDIWVTVPFETVSCSTPPVSKVVQISPELADALRVETKVRRDVNQVFEKARRYLTNMMGSLLNGSAPQIRSAALFLEACRDREVWSYGRIMDDSTYDKLMPYIDHLLRLKNPARPNVRAAENARQLIYQMHCPEFWNNPPPHPSQYNLDWLVLNK